MIHGLDTGFLVAAEILEHAEHIAARDMLVEALARSYIESGTLPSRREADATHVAVATVFQCDYLVSWNHRHMTRPMKRVQFETVNRLQGYLHTPSICNPLEACDELRDR